MRKSLALTVVSLLALTGCAAPTVTESAPPTVSASASPKAAPVAAKPTVNPNEQIEKQFAEFAETRASAHGISDDPSLKKVIAGLHAFCEDGTPFKVSKSSVFNKNLDYAAETAYCESLVK